MTSNGDTAYKYTVPLEVVDGVATPIYDVSTSGEVLYSKVGTDVYVVVQTDSTPHYHKDSINVGVQEVPRDDYPEVQTEDDQFNPNEEQEVDE